VGVLGETASSFADLTLQVLPWFAVGTLTAVLIQTFVPPRWAAGALSGWRGLPVAITAGAVLPGCSCTTMPLAVGLRGMIGPRLGTLTAFVFVSPLLSPITVALTWSLLGWQMTVGRVIAALAGSAIIGLVINRSQAWFEAGRLAPIAGADPAYDACCQEGSSCFDIGADRTGSGSWARALRLNTTAVLREVGPYFLLGMLVAAVLASAVPEDALPGVLGGSSGIAAFALAAVVGIPLYVCEGEEVPLTYGLLATGLGTGPAFTFLMGSVGTCVPTILMSRGILGRRATYFYVGFWILFAIAAGIAFQLLTG
jgi:uncharacterized membrane protein YraQ (UPF0718 family)